MRISFRLILSIFFGTALIGLLFSSLRIHQEERKLVEDLSLRAELVATSFQAAIEPFLAETEKPERIRQFLAKFGERRRLIGMVVYLVPDLLIALPEALAQSDFVSQLPRESAISGENLEALTRWGDRSIHVFTVPLYLHDNPAGSLTVIHDRSYIAERLSASKGFYTLLFMLLAVILSLMTVLIVRFSIMGPLNRISQWTKRVGDNKSNPHADLVSDQGEMGHLFFEVANMASKLKAERIQLQDETQQQNLLQPVSVFWNKDTLKKYLKDRLSGKPLFVVANREPYMHVKTEKGIECLFPPSGMVSAIDPVLQATGGVWVAHGSGNADRQASDAKGRLMVPPDHPAYTLKRLWLNEKEEKGYYHGFSNEGIWPLCHIAHTRPIFRLLDWDMYKKVNRKFANSLLEELPNESPFILVQDYHFALLPQYIKEKRPDAKVALFWHIPWPNPEVFAICPWKEEILQGMLGADIVGFHTQFHCNNFLDTVDRILESRIDWTAFGITRSGKTTMVRPFPISIDPHAFAQTKEEQDADVEEIIKTYHLEGKMIGLGVDRIDYIKGLVERFISIERFFEKYPQYRGKFVFVELGAPSRSTLPGYQNHLATIEKRVKRINEKYQSEGYKPVIFLKEHHRQKRIRNFYRLADVCIVNSLHDGMNLVAKEYVAANEDLNGMLILSRFTGASLELKGALLVNPYDIESTADALNRALSMTPEEKRQRMSRMRNHVLERNVYKWAADLITELVRTF